MLHRFSRTFQRRACAGPLLIGLVASVGCHVRNDPLFTLEAGLQQQAEAWNAGDIHGFMQHYWNDIDLTFSSGGETRYGWQATLDRYLTRYPDRAAMGTLTFEVQHAELLCDDAAYMLGTWQLDREEPVGGNFSLVWRKLPEGWRIVHDHTSVKEESRKE